MLRVNIKEEYEFQEQPAPVDDRDALADEDCSAKVDIKKTKKEEDVQDLDDLANEIEMDDDDEDQEFVPDVITSVSSDSDSEAGRVSTPTFFQFRSDSFLFSIF